ncbi:STN domain-containing protein [Novosphingobium sp.]|uniref:STN domain-containing protein n=1 Tax=Novosphingobium sp. TaxID=1874826 RepID=UPI0038BAE8A1
MTSTIRFRSVLVTLMTAHVLVAAVPVAARDAQRIALDLPAQPLAQSLRDLATASGRTVLADADVVAGKAAPAVHGSYTAGAAISLLLTGSGLTAVEAGNAYAVRAATPGEPNAAQILVTGTRIRGRAPAGAHVIAIDRSAIEQSGLATTQAIMAAIPQNFGGGPNEGTVGFTQRNGSGGNLGVDFH